MESICWGRYDGVEKKKGTSQDKSNDSTPPAYKKDKHKDLDPYNYDDHGESVFRSEQGLGRFSTATPFFDPTTE